MFGNMGQIMSQIQQIQNQVQNLQVEVSCTGGEVTVVMNGKQELLSVHIDPQAISSLGVKQIEDKIVEALNKAQVESRAAVKDQLSKATGLDLNGLMNIFT